MSNNNLTTNVNHSNTLEDEIFGYVITKFNIKAESDLILADIMQDISEIRNFNAFRIYIKANQRHSKYDYLTKLEKCEAIIEDYLKTERNELTEKNYEQIDSFSEELYKRTTTVFDEVDYQMQVKGLSIEQFTSYADNFTSKQLEVLGEVGSVKKIWHLCKYGRNTLRDSILKIVHKKTIMKINTSNQIAHTSNLSLEDLRSKASAV